MARIDLQHRQRQAELPPGALQQALHLQVWPCGGRREHDGAVDQPLGRANVGHVGGERLFQRHDQLGHIRGRVASLPLQRQLGQVGLTLGDAADRLAEDIARPLRPERVHLIGQEKHLHPAGAKAL